MSLKRQAVSGARWMAGNSVLVAVLQFAQLAALAHLLAPEEFGLMAMIMLVLGFAHTFADMGVSKAIIHRQDTTREQLSSLYWLNILAGVVVFGLVVALTPAVVGFFQEPRLGELMMWASLVFLIIPAGQQFQFLLEKHLRFKALGLIEVFGAIAGATAAIGFALAGQGVYSLIWGHLTSVSLKSLMLLYFGWREWRPRLHFRRDDLKGYLGFGLYQMGEQSINYMNLSLDRLLIGALLGAQALGYYNLAFNLVMQPIIRVNPILTRVAFPIFARVQHDDERLKRGYLFVVSVISAINFPILVGLAVVAPWFVPNVFGEIWLSSVVLVQLLSVVALLRSMGNPIGSLLLAKGRADWGFAWNVLGAITRIPVIYFGAQFGGIAGIAGALALAQICYSFASYLFLVRRLLGPCLRPYLGAFGPAGLTAGLMALAVWGLPKVLALDGIRLLAVQVTVGVFVYVALNWLFFRERATEILRLALGRDT